VEHILCNIKQYQITSSARIAETRIPSLQVVPCCYCTSAVTVLWRCSSYRQFVIHPSVNDESKIFNNFTAIYPKYS